MYGPVGRPCMSARLSNYAQSKLRPELLPRAKMNEQQMTNLQTALTGPIASERKGLGSILQRLWRAYLERRAARAAITELNRLDDYMLKDMGIYRGDIVSVVRGPEADKTRRARQ